MTSQKISQQKLLALRFIKDLNQELMTQRTFSLGCWDAQQWVNEKYGDGVKVKYQRIRKYLKQQFKSKRTFVKPQANFGLL